MVASQVSNCQGEMRMHESQWSGREQGYQRTIKKLESKVWVVVILNIIIYALALITFLSQPTPKNITLEISMTCFTGEPA